MVQHFLRMLYISNKKHGNLNTIRSISIDIKKDLKRFKSYLSDLGKGNPFNVHLISGVGLPRALHFRETGGPGCKV